MLYEVITHVTNPGGRDVLELKLVLAGPLDEGEFVQAFQSVCKLRPALVILDPGRSLPENAPALVDERTFD